MHLVVLSPPCIKSTAFVTASSILSATDGEGKNLQYSECVLTVAGANNSLNLLKETQTSDVQSMRNRCKKQMQVKPSFYLQV